LLIAEPGERVNETPAVTADCPHTEFDSNSLVRDLLLFDDFDELFR
jgi:hypothetical protein